MNKQCYEIMQHTKGESKYLDKCISIDTCLDKEQAIEIVKDLNNSKFNEKFKYYYRMRDF